MLDQLRTRRQILGDLVVHYLEPMNSACGRLAYLASLRAVSTGMYAHERLGAVFGEGPVGEVLAKCHEKLFERLLELPLAQQEEDLLRYLGSLPGGGAEIAERCAEIIREWIPPPAPDYLKELFCSNTSALCELLQQNRPRDH